MGLRRIPRAMAADWRAAMVSGKLILNKKGQKIVEASVCIHVRNAKTMFNQAVQEDLILFNPFDRLKGMAREPDKSWKHVSIEELDKLFDTCPSWGWKIADSPMPVGRSSSWRGFESDMG